MTERIIKSYGEDKALYMRLETLADLMNCNALEAGSTTRYWVDDTYLDYGQDWRWTTILRNSKWGDVQVLCPRDWKVLLNPMDNPADAVLKAYDLVTSDKYFSM